MRLVDIDTIDYDEYWNRKDFSFRDCVQAKRILNEQPVVDISGWNPVSERLPEDDGVYLVSGGSKVWFGEFTHFGETRGWVTKMSYPTIKAWMPVPSSYEEVKDDRA